MRRSKNGTNRPKVADLFAGVGGFSLGAARAGFEVAVVIDLDRHAIASHKKNFPQTKHARRDIAKLSGYDLLRLAKSSDASLAGIIGGPPCQGFSPIGRRRKNDSRNSLFFHFFRLVSETKPLFFVAENVPGILNEKYDDLIEESLSLICDDYDCLDCFTLCASDFGAATSRTRVFFIGTLGSLNASLSREDFTSNGEKSKVSVRRALEGLSPRVMQSWQNEESSWRATDSNGSEYVRVINRFCRAVGDKAAMKRFEEKGEVSGCFGTRHNATVVERFSRVRAGSTDKVSRFPRLSWDGLCPTLRAGTDHRRGSYQAVRPIHPDKDRVITPREAARLQGFPDWFQFSPTKWHSFRQIGNSVSPLLAEGVLKIIHCKIFPR